MIHLYYLPTPEKDRWIPGDRFIRPWIRRILRGKPRPGGVDKVFINLVEGLNRIQYPYTINQPLKNRKYGDRILLLGRGLQSLNGFENSPPFISGIGIFTHPCEVPNFTQTYPVLAYLSHSEWVNNLCKPYLGNLCHIWPAGVDTLKYKPIENKKILNDFILYDKLNFNRETEVNRILEPIQKTLKEKGFTWKTIRYGHYKSEDYQKLLSESRYLLFLSPHESQGLACQEAMASGLPVLAFDEGIVRDPYYIQCGSADLQVSSVPWFNNTCGLKFSSIDDFADCLMEFKALSDSGQFHPEKYIQEEFSLEASAQKLLTLVEEIYAQKQTTSPTPSEHSHD